MQAGRRRLAAIVGRIVDKLASRRRSRAARPVQVEAALERIAHRMLVQRDWTDDRAELASRQLTRKLERVPILRAPAYDAAMSRIGAFRRRRRRCLGGEVARHRRRDGQLHQRGLQQEPAADAGPRTGPDGHRARQRMRGVPEHPRLRGHRGGRRRGPLRPRGRMADVARLQRRRSASPPSSPNASPPTTPACATTRTSGSAAASSSTTNC